MNDGGKGGYEWYGRIGREAKVGLRYGIKGGGAG